MRCKLFASMIVAMMTVSVAYAEPFSPTLLKLRAEPEVEYAFDGSPFELPFTVEGTPAGVLLLVYTKDKATDIGIVENGYLGWHWVNKVDTCIYHSTLKSVSPGDYVYEWDGRDQDGGIVKPGKYTYYLWAFDNQGEKQLMSEHIYSSWGFDYSTTIQDVDEQGVPFANPVWSHYGGKYDPVISQWVIGCDPHDETLCTKCGLAPDENWRFSNPLYDPSDFSVVYFSMDNDEEQVVTMRKYTYVPKGVAECMVDWGVGNGFATRMRTKGGGVFGLTTDGNYLYTGSESHVASSEPDANFYIYDFDGRMVVKIDLSPWWSHPADFEAGGQMNGGPRNSFFRNGKVVLNCHCSCINQMVDPVRYLETKRYNDFFVWTNGNGDYTLDHNYEETAILQWVCNDYNSPPFSYSITTDRNNVTVVNSSDIGNTAFGLLGPDGTGFGHFSFASESEDRKAGIIIVDSETPYDGMYCDNRQKRLFNFKTASPNWTTQPGIFFLGHDSISGVITSSGVSVDSEAFNQTPATFSLSQNSPNPFNPTTSIPFTLPKEGRVTMTVYDITGRRVATLVDGAFAAGTHEVVWDASGMASGVYICRLETAEMVKTVKMTLAK